MDFYGQVQDQSTNLAPNGNADGEFIFVPRLEGWLAICELNSIPKHERPRLVEGARYLFEGMHGRLSSGGVFGKDPTELIAQPISALKDVIHG